jgi:hypothetical protein
MLPPRRLLQTFRFDGTVENCQETLPGNFFGKTFQESQGMTIEALIERRKLRRKVQGIAAALLPYESDGRVRIEQFQKHLAATHRRRLDERGQHGHRLCELLVRCGKARCAAVDAGDLGLRGSGEQHSARSELERLALRDAHRPDLRIYTGNDLGINMIDSGSDYLLGLATFAPKKFAERDWLWQNGDSRYYHSRILCSIWEMLRFGIQSPPTSIRRQYCST